MAAVTVRVPGQAGIIEAKQAFLEQAVAHQFNTVTATPTDPNDKARRPSVGDLGARLTTARLA
jgi:hypothetical protein